MTEMMNDTEALLTTVAINSSGIVPAIAQMHDTGEVLRLDCFFQSVPVSAVHP